jgi:adenine-specific DNA-methyltransferase
LASIETLIGQVADKTLQDRLAREIGDLKKRLSWGLVFERHLPENTRVLNAPIRRGTAIWERRSLKPRRFRVIDIEADGDALLVVPAPENGPAPDAEPERIARTDVLVELDFAEPIYPALTSLGAVRNGPADRPYHAVIEGENYHALEMLLVGFEAAFDVVYIDPPYNTGNREWSYNNDYVDPNDTYRPSKWLAFMERRLRLAKRLLRPDGVVVIAIDENEHAHLVMLLEQVLPEFALTSVTIAHNPRGIQGDNFSYTNDFAVFAVRRGQKRIAKRTLLDGAEESPLRNWGGESLRTDARNCFYPIYVKDGVVTGFGSVAHDDFHPTSTNEVAPDGTFAVWPIDVKGVERKWRYARQSVEEIRGQLLARETGRGRSRRWDVFIRKDAGPYRTIWSGPQFDASTYGSQLLGAFGIDFDFPKSLYTMREVLAATTANRPEALILDYFAGSGTTLHATMQLNAEDGGRRRCFLVTNNEVKAHTATKLNRSGHFRSRRLSQVGVGTAIRCRGAT